MGEKNVRLSAVAANRSDANAMNTLLDQLPARLASACREERADTGVLFHYDSNSESGYWIVLVPDKVVCFTAAGIDSAAAIKIREETKRLSKWTIDTFKDAVSKALGGQAVLIQ